MSAPGPCDSTARVPHSGRGPAVLQVAGVLAASIYIRVPPPPAPSVPFPATGTHLLTAPPRRRLGNGAAAVRCGRAVMHICFRAVCRVIIAGPQCSGSLGR